MGFLRKIARLKARQRFQKKGVCHEKRERKWCQPDTCIRIQRRAGVEKEREMPSVCTESLTEAAPGAACWASPRVMVVVRSHDSSSRDAYPPGWHGVIVAIFVVPRQAVGIALARWEHDARPCGNVLAKLATATHVHFKNNHTKEIAVLTGFTLT